MVLAKELVDKLKKIEDFNSQVAEDNSKYIAKLKELIS